MYFWRSRCTRPLCCPKVIIHTEKKLQKWPQMESVALTLCCWSALSFFFFFSPTPPFTVGAKLDHSTINPLRAAAEAAEVSSATRAAQRAPLAMD